MRDITTSKEKLLKKIRKALLEKRDNPYPNLEDQPLYPPIDDMLEVVFAEQFTAQEIIAVKSNESHYPLHYWSRPRAGSDAEVDFIVEYHNGPAPLEVKSGTRGRLRSLLLYLEELKPPAAFVLSQRNVEISERITFLPLYLAAAFRDP